MSKSSRSKNVATLGIFAALVVVLQVLGSVLVRFGLFNISLVLIPIVLGGALYGVKAGTMLGFLFGVVVAIITATPLDVGSHQMFQLSPILTVLLCLVKGTAAGFVSGLISNCSLRKGKPYLTMLLASMAAPIVNTGIFCAAVTFFYRDLLNEWATAAGADSMYFLFMGIVGVNFLLEFAVNVIAAPALSRIKKLNR